MSSSQKTIAWKFPKTFSEHAIPVATKKCRKQIIHMASLVHAGAVLARRSAALAAAGLRTQPHALAAAATILARSVTSSGLMGANPAWLRSASVGGSATSEGSIAIEASGSWAPAEEVAADSDVEGTRTGSSQGLLERIAETLAGAILTIQRTFQPSVVKRKRKHGFLKRNATTPGQRLLARRRRKGRKTLNP